MRENVSAQPRFLWRVGATGCRQEPAAEPSVEMPMPDFPINPPVHVSNDCVFELRSIDEAARFLRGLNCGADVQADGILRRLEVASTSEDAQDAADAFRAWLEGEGLLVEPTQAS